MSFLQTSRTTTAKNAPIKSNARLKILIHFCNEKSNTVQGLAVFISRSASANSHFPLCKEKLRGEELSLCAVVGYRGSFSFRLYPLPADTDTKRGRNVSVSLSLQKMVSTFFLHPVCKFISLSYSRFPSY